MVEHVFGELLCLFVAEVFANPVGVEAGFVHADKADGREVVVERAEIAFGVGIKPFIQKTGDDVTLDF